MPIKNTRVVFLTWSNGRLWPIRDKYQPIDSRLGAEKRLEPILWCLEQFIRETGALPEAFEVRIENEVVQSGKVECWSDPEDKSKIKFWLAGSYPKILSTYVPDPE